MKACILTSDYPPILGGIPNYTKGLHDGFKALGHQCTVVFSPINSTYEIHREDVFVHPLKGKRHFQMVRSSKMMLHDNMDIIMESDLVLIPTWSPIGIAYTEIDANQKPKSILLAHGNDILEPSKSFRYRRLMKRVFHSFDIVATNSHFTADLCLKITGRKSVPVGGGLNGNFLRSARSKKADNKSSGPFTFLSVGRLVKRKGFDMVIKSLGTIRSELSNWRYVIIGSGAVKGDLEQLISDFYLQDRVIILQEQAFENLFSWYQNCDVFIMVSRPILADGEIEGLGLVYMEAGAAGRPVIAGDSGGVSDVVKEGFNGLLVNPLSEEAISDAILTLYQNRELRKTLGKNGRILAETEWRWEKVVQNILDSIP